MNPDTTEPRIDAGSLPEEGPEVVEVADPKADLSNRVSQTATYVNMKLSVLAGSIGAAIEGRVKVFTKESTVRDISSLDNDLDEQLFAWVNTLEELARSGVLAGKEEAIKQVRAEVRGKRGYLSAEFRTLKEIITDSIDGRSSMDEIRAKLAEPSNTIHTTVFNVGNMVKDILR